MKRKSKKMLVCLISIIVVFISIISIMITMNMQSRLYDKSKPNIFEIPGTAYQYEVSRIKYYNYYFMVQQYPNDNAALQAMISKFIDENSEYIASKSSSTTIYLYFMKPSFNFPVYFEENKNYFIMDDYVTHYKKTNEIVLVTFEENDCNYIFTPENY